MPTYRCRKFIVDEDQPSDHKPREATQFSVTAPSCDAAIKAARKFVRDRGEVLRAANLTHNRLEIAVYVYRQPPKNRLPAKTIRESDLAKGATDAP